MMNGEIITRNDVEIGQNDRVAGDTLSQNMHGINGDGSGSGIATDGWDGSTGWGDGFADGAGLHCGEGKGQGGAAGWNAGWTE